MIKKELQQLKDGLIVSCQAPEGSPLHRVDILTAFALTAEQNGAAGVRICGAPCIAEVAKRIHIPIVGLEKLDIPGNEIYITPTRDSARHVASSGCGLVAIDATQRPRAKDESLEAIVEVLRKEFSVAIVCDVSSVEEGIYAEELGVDAVATTLAAFARDMHGRALPNFGLLAALARRLRIPLICEGAISTPHQVRRAFEEGAFAVCVGRALTGLDWLVQQYHEATPRMTQAPTSLTAQERRET